MSSCSVLRTNALLFAVALLAACGEPPPPKDAHVPDFARLPYEPFDRESAVAIAYREWRLFGQPVGDAAPAAASQVDTNSKPERLPGLWQRVGEYWWLGLNSDQRRRALTGKHAENGSVFPADLDEPYAWSAAFISYIMRIAGAGHRFPYSDAHSDYINKARRASPSNAPASIVRAERISAYAPQRGDLICYARGTNGEVRFHDLPTAARFGSHCDIVVAVDPGQISVIGGNVLDAVAMKHVPITLDGKLAEHEEVPIDSRYSWFVVIRVRYDR